MFGSSIIDSAIGLAFVFLLVSVLVTTANEMIASALRSRAKWLRMGLESLLGSDWAATLYAHPLIKGYSGGGATTLSTMAGGAGPSYIPSRTFSGVMMDMLGKSETAAAGIRKAVQDAIDRFPAATGSLTSLKKTLGDVIAGPAFESNPHRDALRRLFEQLPDESAITKSLMTDLQSIATKTDPSLGQTRKDLDDFIRELQVPEFNYARSPVLERISGIIAAIQGSTTIREELTAVTKRITAPGYTVGDAKKDVEAFLATLSYAHLAEAIALIPYEPLKKTLTVILQDAKRNAEDFTQNLEIWFNNGMDRIGGWYKRRTQWVVLGLSAIISIGLNVDGMAVLNQLGTSPGLRDALVAQAKAYSEKNPVVVVGAEKSTTVSEKTPEELEAKFKSVHMQLGQLNLPIGWFSPKADRNSTPPVTDETVKFRTDNFLIVPTTIGKWFDTITFHLVGWLLTIIAASLGAPFWFDVLNKIMSVRSVGKSPEETPKSPKTTPPPLGPGQSPAVADILAAARQQ